ncbi:MAG: hypothetical protein GY791_12475 [Alphaproteobacteria bacterium]|nr:hypothetical protein [Alphaproteobacteria bacterium]
MTITPVEPEQSIGWILLASNYDEVYSAAEVAEFTELIIGQDIRIVESQRPKSLPLDSDAEFHLRCDRTSLQYRKWLADLGLTYGTIAAHH